MRTPWQNRTGYAKAVAILATVLTVSLGLCGANFLAVVRFVPLGGPAPPPATPTWPATFLSITAWIEIAGIVGSLFGLAVVFDLKSRRERHRSHSESSDPGDPNG